MSAASIVSVNTGQAQPVEWDGLEFTTAIVKRPTRERIAVRGVNLAGDDQADRTVHGGPSKAVYAYAAEDYAWWSETLRQPIAHGTFGDNLTIAGLDLSGAKVGERWRAGTAVLEVSEPRVPCYKLGYAMNDRAFPKQFARELRPGAYLRIIDEGAVQAGDEVELLVRPDHDVTLRDVLRIRMFAHEERARLLAIPGLSLAWRGWASQ